MNVLNWISDIFEQAVLRGVARAVAKLELSQDDDSPLATLTARMTSQTPVAIEADSKPRKISK